MVDVQDLIRRGAERAATQRHTPISTYRLQFHAGFTFKDATAIIPYLADLGITHVYASPYLRAKPGSTHGYDVIDHCRLNPEVGTTEEFDALLAALRERGMSHILDTVPNHVGVATNDNAWWNDVLENGTASRYGSYFDITWRSSLRPELQDKVLLPTLGGPYATVLEKGDLKLTFEQKEGAFYVSYYDRRFPISPRTYATILGRGSDESKGASGSDDRSAKAYLELVAASENLPDGSDRSPAAVETRHRQKEELKRELAALVGGNERVRKFVEQRVTALNGKPGDAASFDELDSLLQHQCYRLSYWRVASDEINYRRFFDINDLAALSMQRPEVFESTHAFILRLLGEGKIGGLRIDHPDGLYDPAAYFVRLQQHYQLACAMALYDAEHPQAGDEERKATRAAALARLENGTSSGSNSRKWPLYVTAEKILAVDEPLPTEWAVAGTSGYDFLVMVNSLFVDPDNAGRFTELYSQWTGDATPFAELVYRNKRLILETSLASELHMLAHQLDRLAQRARGSRDFTLRGLSQALREVIACFPVYRTYIVDEKVTNADRQRIESAVQSAIGRNPLVDASIFHYIRDTLLQRRPASFTEQDKAAQRYFTGKFQQLVSPVTAKGIEDTTFYQYNRLITLNEVGGDPAQFGIAPDHLHRYLSDRQKNWPLAMSTLSTHDTKRSEDLRARLNVLSEMPDEWAERVQTWRRLNAKHRVQPDGGAPTPDEEYLLYQTLIGAWPTDPSDREERHGLVERVQAYMLKAMREAKLRTTWGAPNAEHEGAMKTFIDRVLDPQSAGDFLGDFEPFERRVARFGYLNSLSQTLLKLASPGVPDTYQGTEFVDLSLVDPDNRRPVNYDARRSELGRSKEGPSTLSWPTNAVEQNRAKLRLHTAVLHLRQQLPELYGDGEYLSLQGTGSKSRHLFGFARRNGDRIAIVVVPRFVYQLLGGRDGKLDSPDVWGDTRVALADFKPTRFRHAISGQSIELDSRQTRSLAPADLFSGFPVCLLVSE